jgi:hypothetical protein
VAVGGRRGAAGAAAGSASGCDERDEREKTLPLVFLRKVARVLGSALGALV